MKEHETHIPLDPIIQLVAMTFMLETNGRIILGCNVVDLACALWSLDSDTKH